MTTVLYLATDHGPRIVTRRSDRWWADSPLGGRAATCLAVDPERPERVVCDAGKGVSLSEDAGRTWRRVLDGGAHGRITALAVGAAERAGGHGVIYVGTEPSAVLRSDDGGATWHRCEGLDELPSSSEWSFPPRPQTHHVRWIEPDPHRAGRLFVAIEAGALVRSPDGGRTWRDRVPGGPYDTHRLITHPRAPGRLWSAAGDGFFESDDGGDSWRRSEEGLRFRYCWSVAVDPGDPRSVVLSAAPGARQAHTSEHAESALYRRTGDGPWQQVRDGLPAPRDTRAPVLATSPAEPGVFYAAADTGLYRSADRGGSWQRLEVDGSAPAAGARAHGLAAVG